VGILRKSVEKIQVSLKSDKNDGTLHEDRCTFLIISRSVPSMINISDKSHRGNENTHFVLIKFFFRKSCRFLMTWKNIVERDRPQMTIWRMRITCWIPKATNRHSEYVNTYCLPSAKMVARKRLVVTFYVHFLSLQYSVGITYSIVYLLSVMGSQFYFYHKFSVICPLTKLDI
jgi:hypothetical protein